MELRRGGRVSLLAALCGFLVLWMSLGGRVSSLGEPLTQGVLEFWAEGEGGLLRGLLCFHFCERPGFLLLFSVEVY